MLFKAELGNLRGVMAKLAISTTWMCPNVNIISDLTTYSMARVGSNIDIWAYPSGRHGQSG
jgi:hypothetical protein